MPLIENSQDARSLPPPRAPALDPEWWRGAVIYQIYPRSFADSNDDGIGDLQGVTARLDYVASLGVDAIWISPFFKSPMKDFGYDISDYREIDAIFGTLDDFDRLVDRAHRLGLRVMIDQVLSHTSDQHRWFEASRQSRDNDKADWYVWADPKPDGTPPNNWLSIFGGPAWQWEPRRGQYYLHNFLVSQPDLNFHNPAVVKQILEEVEFWLKRGIDGLRLDAINFCFHDPLLRDNPAKPEEERRGRGFRTDNPYAFQYHRYDNTQPENPLFLEKLRRLIDRYPSVVTLGEISGDEPLDIMVQYTAGRDRLHMAYNFELLVDGFSIPHIRNTIETLESKSADCWPCWAIGNHDVARVASRWANGAQPGPWAKLLNAFLFSLRGDICSYQGEELGLGEADVPRDALQDPYGLNFWPAFKGRDGCRTPMPWTNGGTACGFSRVQPWLPIPPEHRASAIDTQHADPDSVLNAYRTFLRWRARHPALRFGAMRFVDSPADTLCFLREHDGKALLACFNFSTEPRVLPVTGMGSLHELSGHGFASCRVGDGRVEIPGLGAFFGYLGSAS